MPSTLKAQNFYYTTVTSESIPSSGAFTFNVATPPSYQNGFLVIATENVLQREIVYFHSVSGNTVSVRAENRGLGGTSAKEHIQGESVTMKDVAEIFNFYSDSVSTCFYVEKTGGLTVKVWGGAVYYNTVLTTVADTSLTLTDNATNYIKYSYTTNTITADTVNVGNIKATVIVSSGVILSIVYTVAKETYTDFTVSLNTALPSQPGNAGKVLTTDGTNATWQDTAIPTASTTAKGVVEIATTLEGQGITGNGSSGAPVVISPASLVAYYSKGDGSDGSITISTNTTLTRDMYYTDLTVNTAVTLDPAGYRIFCSGTLTLTGTAKIARNGNAGGNGSGTTAGGGATALATGTCGPCLGGVAGGNGTGGVGVAGSNGASVATSYVTVTGVSGGTGGIYIGAPGAGGTGGTSTQGSLYNTSYSLASILGLLTSPSLGLTTTTVYGGTPSNGGGGGGSANGAGNGGGGGGSGGQGGIIFIYANIIAGTGTIEAKGGVGGNGGNGTTNSSGGGGSGAGGNGGVVVLTYGSGTPWTITVTGGAPGTVGNGLSGGTNGSAGGTGASGISILINK